MMNTLKKVRTLIFATAFLVACSKGGDKGNQPAPATPEGKKEDTRKIDEAQANKQEPGGSEQQQASNNPAEEKPPEITPTFPGVSPPIVQASPTPSPSPGDSNFAVVPTPSPSPSKEANIAVPPPSLPKTETPKEGQPKTVASVIDAQDLMGLLLTRYLTTNDPAIVENDSGRIVKDMYADEGERPAKVLELQTTLGKLKENGLYTPNIEDHVKYLQEKVDIKNAENQAYGIVSNSVLFLVAGTATGTFIGKGGLKKLPEWSSAAVDTSGRWASATGRFFKEDIYGRGRRLATKEAAANGWNSTSQWGRAKWGQLTAWLRRPIKPAETLVWNNLEDLGLTMTQKNLIRNLRKVDARDLPTGLEWTRTPKSTFQFATLNRTLDIEQQPLGINLAFVFRQSRAIRGSAFDTYYVSEPIHAQAARSIADRLRLRAVEPPDRQFVHILDLRTHVVTATRWTGRQVERMYEAAGQRIRPFFADFDTPVALGSGLVTTAALGGVYVYGYENGRSSVLVGDVDLEKMVKEQRPGAAR